MQQQHCNSTVVITKSVKYSVQLLHQLTIGCDVLKVSVDTPVPFSHPQVDRVNRTCDHLGPLVCSVTWNFYRKSYLFLLLSRTDKISGTCLCN